MSSTSSTPWTHPPPRPTMDLAGSLPTGTWILEASAGTGKTYAIAGLVTRYVAEGVATIDQVLAVTFGRAATSELRSRVRERLVSVRDALSDPASARQGDDVVLAHLATGDPAKVAERGNRLATALADFDAATVATVHEFCQQVLVGAGIAADFDPGTRLVEDLDDVRDQVAEDIYLRWVLSTEGDPGAFPVDRARAIAAAAVRDRTARLLPSLTGLERGNPAAVRVRYADAVRREFDRRTRGARVVGFDDLLGRVRDSLVDPASAAVSAQRLRDRYRVVLVDEFQDTDPVQWDVLRLAFHGHRTLVVIGDPKQAIYAFRGADVRAYLSAVDTATSYATLDRNWRSDAPLVQGLQLLFRGAALGDQRISVAEVAVGHADHRLLDDRGQGSAVEVRQLLRTGLPLNQGGLIASERARAEVAADVTARIRSVLAAGWTVTPRGSSTPRPVHAGDIAVLVRKLAHATLVRDQLRDSGIPVVLTSAESVYLTSAAADWITLIQALEQPNRNARVRAAALTSLIGKTAAEVDHDGQDGADELRAALRRWAAAFADRGVAAMFDDVARERSLAARLLGLTDGERLLTDLRHVGEALHERATRERLGLGGLLSWLHERVAEAANDPDQERSRRLDKDANAVQVTTVHTSKGLEFPIVLVPYGWDGIYVGDRERTPRGHADDGTRTLHVGGRQAEDYQAACHAEEIDDAGEELRLLYVAATRAISKLVLWWAPTALTKNSSLHRLLHTADPAIGIPANISVDRDDTVIARRFSTFASVAEALTTTEFSATSSAPSPMAGLAVPDAPLLQVARLDRELDQRWRRTSYSGLTRTVHEQGGAVMQEPQVGVKDDEGPENQPEDEPGASSMRSLDPPENAGYGANQPLDVPAGTAAHPDAALLEVISPMGELPAGAEFGTLVHAILEHADLTAASPMDALLTATREELRWRHRDLDAVELAAALLPATQTPWGPIADGACLADFGRDDRLTELDFELPLAGGDRGPAWGAAGSAGAPPVVGDLADLLEAHLPADDPVRPYAEMMRTPGFAQESLVGYLSGSIDLVVRAGTGGGSRYVVIDHKTNRLGPPDVALTAWHYRRAAMDDAVRQAHYPLQAMLYSVALHRFLRWRLADYDPARHLGGVAYLFLRGMCGPDAPTEADGSVPGVWAWQPPATLVAALSDALAGTQS